MTPTVCSVAGIACCVLVCLIIVGVGLGLGLKNSANEQCSEMLSAFMDLPNTYSMEEQWFANAGSAGTLRVDNGWGVYSTDWTLVGTRYTYRDANGQVAAQAERGFLARTFRVTRCPPPHSTAATVAPEYEITQDWFDFGSIEYDLKRDSVLVARPSKSTVFQCKPDIVMASVDEDATLATIDRSCGESFVRDRWYITNYANATIENYVLGFMAFLTTVAENEND